LPTPPNTTTGGIVSTSTNDPWRLLSVLAALFAIVMAMASRQRHRGRGFRPPRPARPDQRGD
jgi:hypothetical protein